MQNKTRKVQKVIFFGFFFLLPAAFIKSAFSNESDTIPQEKPPESSLESDLIYPSFNTLQAEFSTLSALIDSIIKQQDNNREVNTHTLLEESKNKIQSIIDNIDKNIETRIEADRVHSAINKTSKIENLQGTDDLNLLFTAFYSGSTYAIGFIALIAAVIFGSGAIVRRKLWKDFQRLFTEFKVSRDELIAKKVEAFELYTTEYAKLSATLTDQRIGFQSYKEYEVGLKRIAQFASDFRKEGEAKYEYEILQDVKLESIPKELSIDYYQAIAELEKASRLASTTISVIEEIISDDKEPRVTSKAKNLKSNAIANVMYYSIELYRHYDGATSIFGINEWDADQYKNRAQRLYGESCIDIRKKGNANWHHWRETQLYTKYFLNKEVLKSDHNELSKFKCDIQELFSDGYALQNPDWIKECRQKWNVLLSRL